MSEKIPQDTTIHTRSPTIRGNIAVGVFTIFVVFIIIVFAFVSVDNIVIFILIAWLPLILLARLYYVLFKDIKKIRAGYYNTIPG